MQKGFLFNKKIVIAGICSCVSCAIVLGVVLSSQFKTQLNSQIEADQEYYMDFNATTRLFNDSKTTNIVNSAGHGASGEYPSPITFINSNIQNVDSNWISLLESGYFYNQTQISGLKSIVINYSGEGSLTLNYGWASSNYEISDVSLISGAAYLFNNELPGFFYVLNNNDNAIVIESMRITYSCKATSDPYIVPVGMNFTLASDSSSYLVSSYSGSLTELSIPYTYNSLPVSGVTNFWVRNAPNAVRIIHIFENVVSLSSSSFNYLNYLTEVDVLSNNVNYASHEGVLYDKGITSLIYFPTYKSGEYIVPSSVTTIPGGSLASITQLDYFVIPSTVKTIGYQLTTQTDPKLVLLCEPESRPSGWSGMFNIYNSSIVWGYLSKGNTNGLKYVVYQIGGVKSIAITGLDDIFPQEINIPRYFTIDGENIDITQIQSYAFYEEETAQRENDITRVSFATDSKVNEIAAYAFYNCMSLEYINIPASLKTIYPVAFTKTLKLQTFDLSADNPYFSLVDDILYNKNQTILVRCPGGKVGAVNNIPSTVTQIMGYAFDKCNYINELVLPDGITDIGTAAFQQLSDDVSKTGLTNVVLPSALRSIPDRLFEMCVYLKTVTIKDNVTSIGYLAFYECLELETVNIPSSVTSISQSSFANTFMLSYVYIPSSVLSIGSGCFGQMGRDKDVNSNVIECQASEKPSNWNANWANGANVLASNIKWGVEPK